MKKFLACGLVLTIVSSIGTMCFAKGGNDEEQPRRVQVIFVNPRHPRAFEHGLRLTQRYAEMSMETAAQAKKYANDLKGYMERTNDMGDWAKIMSVQNKAREIRNLSKIAQEAYQEAQELAQNIEQTATQQAQEELGNGHENLAARIDEIKEDLSMPIIQEKNKACDAYKRIRTLFEELENDYNDIEVE